MQLSFDGLNCELCADPREPVASLTQKLVHIKRKRRFASSGCAATDARKFCRRKKVTRD